MAVVIDPRWRILDASGNAVVGATLTLYVAGGTTLATIYADSGLTTPITNPLSGVNASDANGRFPQFYATEGAIFDVLVKNSAGTTLVSYTNVPATGAESGAFTRDLIASRFKVSNSGGVVEIESGNATGDDVGGTARIGGWAGTQGDALTLDYATVDTTGTFTENGKKLSNVVQTAGGTSSGSASVIIALPNAPTNCRQYDIDIIDISGSSSGNTTLTVSTDNGATYVAAGYYSVASTSARAGGSATGSNNAVNAIVAQLNTLTAATATLRVTTPRTTGRAMITGGFFGDCVGAAGEEAEQTYFNAVTASLSARVTHIKLTFPATVSCTYRVRPARGFGE